MSKILYVVAKSADLNNITLPSGVELDGYIPDNLGIGGGDYIRLSIDVETGKILDWDKEEVTKAIEDLEERNKFQKILNNDWDFIEAFQSMDIPSSRRHFSEENLEWLIRNLGIRNNRHPKFNFVYNKLREVAYG